MVAPITIYGTATYDRGAKARWLLSELGVKHENQWLSSEKKEYESPEYLQINPLGRVPAMKVGERSMFESGALCAFLADQYLEKGLAPALSSPERMDYQQWMYFAASTIDPFVTRIMIIEDIPQGELFTKKESVLMTEAKDAFQYLDQVLAKNNFLVGNRFTAADICVGYHLYFLMLWPEFKTLVDQNKNVANYMNRLRERPAAIAANVFSFEE